MSRKLKFSSACRARALQLLGSGQTSADVASRLAREFDPAPSRRWVAELADEARELRREQARALLEDEELAPLEAAIDEAETDVQFAKAKLALFRHQHPEFDDGLESGRDVLEALGELHDVEIDVADEPLWLLRDPKLFAQLAIQLTEVPGMIEDFTAAERRAEGKAELERAVALLEGALDIVKRRGIAERWRTKGARA